MVDDAAEAEFPRFMSARVRVQTRRGSFEKFVRVAKGEPENVVSLKELRAKFDGLTAPYLSAGRRDALLGALLGIEQLTNVGELLRLARPEVGAGRGAGFG